MDAAGNPREGWMAVIPLTVFVLLVVYVLGGPVHVVNLVSQWSVALVTAIGNWVRHL